MRRLIDIVTGARLDEISRPASRLDADQVLRRAGYQRLGKGSFGAVYQKPGRPYVLKVISSRDRSYLDFIALARAHSTNPHFPRFYGKLVRVTPEYYGVRMEPLKPYRHDPTTIADYLTLRDYQGNPNSYLSMRRDDAFEFMEEYPDLRAACDLIIDNLLTKYPHDIKQDNLMLRGNTIVITDPVKTLNSGEPEVRLPAMDPPPSQSPDADQPLNLSHRDKTEIEDLYRQLLD